MLRPDFPTVKPVAGVDPVRPAVPVSDARQEAFDRSMSSLLGQPVKGEVLARLTDGSSLVRVAGNSVRMPLPEGAQVGAQVPLTLVSLSPRPTFEVGGQPGGVEAHLATIEAGPPDGGAHEPLVYLDGHGVPTRAGQATTGTPVQAALPTAPDTPDAAAGSAADTADGAAPAGRGGAPNAGAADAAAARAASAGAGAAAAARAAAAGLAGDAAARAAAGLGADTAAALAFGPGGLAGAVAAARAAALRSGYGLPPAADGPEATRASPEDAPAARAAAGATTSGDTDPAAARRAALANSAAQLTGRTAYNAALLGRAPLIPAELLPDIDPASTPAELSRTAQVLTSVLARAQDAAPQTAVVARTPLVPPGPIQPEQLAQALRNAIGKSGLFYESHVRAWSEGELAVGELAGEPQARAAAAGRPPQPGDPATAAFINLQLGTQEQGRVVWQGPAWPGQDMHWEIQRDVPERQGGGEPPPGWRTGMRFRFAALGEVNATVLLHGDRVHVQLETGNGAVGTLLREQAPALSSALDAAGTPLASFDVHTKGVRRG